MLWTLFPGEVDTKQLGFRASTCNRLWLFTFVGLGLCFRTNPFEVLVKVYRISMTSIVVPTQLAFCTPQLATSKLGPDSRLLLSLEIHVADSCVGSATKLFCDYAISYTITELLHAFSVHVLSIALESCQTYTEYVRLFIISNEPSLACS